MYTIDSKSTTPLYESNKLSHGFKITDIERALESIDFSRLHPFHKHQNTYETQKTVNLSEIQEGNLAFIQKGKKQRMSTPFIVSNVEYNPNENTESIGIDLTSTNSRVVDVHIYAQLPENPREMGAINFYRDTQYITAKDNSTNRLADNGNIWIIPDEYILNQLTPDINPKQGLHIII